jgi:glutamyl/glutaminyl-tRNA synthetase
MNCGYVMRSSKSRGKHYLKCASRHIAKDSCIGSFISVERLEQAVLAELQRLADEYLDKDELEQGIELCDTLHEQKEQIEESLSVYRKKIAEYKSGISELYLDKVKGIITESDYLEFSKDFTSKKTQLEQLIADYGRQIADIETRIAEGDNRKEVIERYNNMEHLSREVVEELIDYISVGKRTPGTCDIPIEIHWQF